MTACTSSNEAAPRGMFPSPEIGEVDSVAPESMGPVFPIGDDQRINSALIASMLGGLSTKGGVVAGAAVGAAEGIIQKKIRIARAILYSDDLDQGKFGAFSYLIATNNNKAIPVGVRLEAAINVYTQQPSLCERGVVDPMLLNVFSVPVVSKKPKNPERVLCKKDEPILEKLMTEYDIARAAFLADKAGLSGDGPYLVASLVPLSTIGENDRDKLLIWDMSSVEPRLIRLFVDRFIRSANSPGNWNMAWMSRWTVELRNWVAIGGEGWSVTQEAAASSIKGPKSE